MSRGGADCGRRLDKNYNNRKTRLDYEVRLTYVPTCKSDLLSYLAPYDWITLEASHLRRHEAAVEAPTPHELIMPARLRDAALTDYTNLRVKHTSKQVRGVFVWRGVDR